MAMPVNNITFTAPITSPVTNATFLPSRTLKPDLQTDEPTTGSVMTKDATSCSLEVCAEQHFWVLASVAGFNVFFLILVALCIRARCKTILPYPALLSVCRSKRSFNWTFFCFHSRQWQQHIEVQHTSLLWIVLCFPISCHVLLSRE